MPKAAKGQGPTKSNSAKPKPVAVAKAKKSQALPVKTKAAAKTSASAQATLPLQVPAAPSGGVKSKRTRVPKNFADQYSTSPKTPARAAAPIPVAKARKSTQRRKAEQKIRADLMAPSDDIVARLARMGSITGTVLGAEIDEPDDTPATGKKRASRNWEHRCGKCGTVATMRKPVGVCPTCGAIAVRE